MSDEHTATATYVVQRYDRWTDDSGNLIDEVWIDVATVTVPTRTTRRTIIKKALAQAGIQPTGEPLKLRALDVESARVHEPEGYQPPMEWRL
jgi:hypothetical protein